MRNRKFSNVVIGTDCVSIRQKEVLNILAGIVEQLNSLSVVFRRPTTWLADTATGAGYVARPSLIRSHSNCWSPIPAFGHAQPRTSTRSSGKTTLPQFLIRGRCFVRLVCAF